MRSLKLLKLLLGIFIVSLSLTGCEDNNYSKLEYFGDIRIETEKEIFLNESANLYFTFISEVIDRSNIEWESADPDIARIFVNPDKTCTVTGVSLGETIIRLTIKDQGFTQECLVTVTERKEPVDDGIIRILAIGNSFSEDAIETYLYDLAKTDGKTVIIGNMFIPGCRLDMHLANAKGDLASYNYRKISAEGKRTTEDNWSISKAIADENWDYISFQQESSNSGVYSSYEASLPGLVNYVKGLNKNPKTKYILHQTWAYAKTTGHAGFNNYGKDQMTMYNAIVDAVDKAKTLVNADIVVPSGTAIQNARTSLFGDNMNVGDGYHLAQPRGRYTAACTWYATLFGADVTKNTYKPSNVSAFHDEVIKAAAQAAALAPKVVTDLVDYKAEDLPNDFILQHPIYICFNQPEGSAIPSPFQNFRGFKSVEKLEGLKDDQGTNTKFTLESTVPSNASNDLGSTTSLIDWIPNIVSKYAFYGENGRVAKFTVARLNPNESYKFEFYGSRAATSADSRETKYTVIGVTQSSVLLEAHGNNSNTVISTPVQANADGTIVIEVGIGPGNTNSSKFYYLNALRIMPG